MYFDNKGPGAIRGLLFKDASSHRASIPRVFRQAAPPAPPPTGEAADRGALIEKRVSLSAVFNVRRSN
jgi:hypothetical protein